MQRSIKLNAGAQLQLGPSRDIQRFAVFNACNRVAKSF